MRINKNYVYLRVISAEVKVSKLGTDYLALIFRKRNNQVVRASFSIQLSSTCLRVRYYKDGTELNTNKLIGRWVLGTCGWKRVPGTDICYQGVHKFAPIPR